MIYEDAVIVADAEDFKELFILMLKEHFPDTSYATPAGKIGRYEVRCLGQVLFEFDLRPAPSSGGLRIRAAIADVEAETAGAVARRFYKTLFEHFQFIKYPATTVFSEYLRAEITSIKRALSNKSVRGYEREVLETELARTLAESRERLFPVDAEPEGKPRQRGSNKDTSERGREVQRLLDVGWQLTRACKHVGMDTRTYRRWLKEEEKS